MKPPVGGSPAGEGRGTGVPSPAGHIHCAACDQLITPDQYPTAFCWVGPLEGSTVAAHGACLGIYLEIEASAALGDI